MYAIQFRNGSQMHVLSCHTLCAHYQTTTTQRWCNALLLKVNQIGTISEAMAAAKMIFEDHGNVIVSHRSGEMPGSLIADLVMYCWLKSKFDEIDIDINVEIETTT